MLALVRIVRLLELVVFDKAHRPNKKPGIYPWENVFCGQCHAKLNAVIVAFQKARVEFDQDLLDLSKQRIQVAVEVGMSLGHVSSV